MTDPSLRWPSWVGVVAEDLERQRVFYRDVLGLRESDSGRGWVQFDMGEGRLLEVLQRSDEPQYAERRVQVGFEVDDIGTARAALIERGVEPVSGIEGGEQAGSRWAYLKDAEGNVFEITERPSPT
jgi:predicted enzyme related to lactoylglutathione lyase